MEIAMHIPRWVPIAFGALVAAAAGIAAASLFPTPVEGFLNGHLVHGPTSAAMFVMTGAGALAIYMASVMLLRRRTSGAGQELP